MQQGEQYAEIDGYPSVYISLWERASQLEADDIVSDHTVLTGHRRHLNSRAMAMDKIHSGGLRDVGDAAASLLLHRWPSCLCVSQTHAMISSVSMRCPAFSRPHPDDRQPHIQIAPKNRTTWLTRTLFPFFSPTERIRDQFYLKYEQERANQSSE